MYMGDVIDIYLYEGVVCKDGIEILSFKLSSVLFDEVCVGGCILLIIGCGLISCVCVFFGLVEFELFVKFVDFLVLEKGYIFV